MKRYKKKTRFSLGILINENLVANTVLNAMFDNVEHCKISNYGYDFVISDAYNSFTVNAKAASLRRSYNQLRWTFTTHYNNAADFFLLGGYQWKKATTLELKHLWFVPAAPFQPYRMIWIENDTSSLKAWEPYRINDEQFKFDINNRGSINNGK